MKLWHINDRGARGGKKVLTPIVRQDSMELGTGNLDLDGMMKTALENGVVAAVLESHRNWIGGDAMRSIETSAMWFGRSSE